MPYSDSGMDSPEFAKFDISRMTHNVSNGQNVQLLVLKPENILSGKYPIMAQFHGGFFVNSPPIP